MTEWLPIETAPKDGTRILAWPCDIDFDDTASGAFGSNPAAVEGVACVSWVKTYGVWWVSPNESTEDDPENNHPTHWMPLPVPPVEKVKAA